MSTSEYELLKIKTFVLKVHMNCQGCMNRVRKVLRKIEGVYRVDINAEEQKVTVVCRVNPTTLVQKLAKHGKHAEICSAGYNQEQLSHVRDKNMNQSRYEIEDSNDSENQYMIPTFVRRDHWGPRWHLNQDMGGRAVESEINQHPATPFFLEDFNNRTYHNFTRINENPKWEESMVPMMSTASFQENGDTDYSSLGSQEWAQKPLGVSPISEHGDQTTPMANIYGYPNNYHPSNMMQRFTTTIIYHGELTSICRRCQTGITQKHHEMTSQVFSPMLF